MKLDIVEDEGEDEEEGKGDLGRVLLVLNDRLESEADQAGEEGAIETSPGVGDGSSEVVVLDHDADVAGEGRTNIKPASEVKS